MNVKIGKGPLNNGQVRIISSKSDGHRSLIAAALAEEESVLFVDGWSDDMEATMRCLKGLGAELYKEPSGIEVVPIPRNAGGKAVLDCGESGSTLRFLLPVASALGKNALFEGKGRLPERPIGILLEEMEQHGCKANNDHLPVELEGKLQSGVYTLPGNVSSQFITGLLFALPILEGNSEIRLTTDIESKGYIDMTLKTLKTFGVEVKETEHGWIIPGGQKYQGPRMRFAEGDWSNAAFWLVAGAIHGSIGCQGLDMESPQGDRAIVSLLEEFGAESKIILNQVTMTHKEMKGIRIDASQIPDLVPILCVAAAAAECKTEIYNAGRLRIKESDRLAAMAECMKKIGVEVEEKPDGIIITGGCNPPAGEIVIDSHNDHRIVMAMAIAAVSLGVELTIEGADAVNKSYPSFFLELQKLGGVVDVL
ncbi:3-phosphoshikimate 1-carboxyvinyltransferase [Anaerotignum sp.]|nr:3-phosphoshikimate 1-carboxyvinyltransferase [Anaerotignum sp.]MBQ7757875.1 3-phosphoshikimate 1-carboxyvinyltransferase [Anaerotignum sp.]